MRFAVALLSTIAGGFFVTLAVVLIRFNQRRLAIARIAAAATSDDLESIYKLIEDTTREQPCGCVLGRTNQKASHTRCIVALPQGLDDFPWSGRTVEVESAGEVVFRFIDQPVAETACAGRVLRPILVPRIKLSSGKYRNVFSPKRLIASSDTLEAALRRLSQKHPDDLLSYLLCVGRESFEFEPIDQARIGTSPAWVQDPEWPTCPRCRRKQGLILQIPGTLFAPQRKGTYYWFGCRKHPDATQLVEQFT